MAERVIREFAPAKINLFLHVGEKRSDGFHAVQSLVAFASIGDSLEFTSGEELSLEITGPFASALRDDEDNLVLKAARALAQEVGTKAVARIVLSKNLPVSSGIGGGSADAAATLRGLARLWRIGAAETAGVGIAATLGSDVPVCLASVASWMEGRGELVTPAIPLPPMAVVLCNPGIAVATREVFAGLCSRRGVAGQTARWSSTHEFVSYLRTTTNDLEVPARVLAPVIGEVLDALAACRGVLLARMSGSGATCFGLLDSDVAAVAAAKRITETHPDWWVVPARLASAS